MTFLPQPEAPGPNPGQPGHYADHEWITLALNALDDALMASQGPKGFVSSMSFGGAFPQIGDWIALTLPEFTITEQRVFQAVVMLSGRSVSAGNGVEARVQDSRGTQWDSHVAVWAPSSFPAHSGRTLNVSVPSGSHTVSLRLIGYGANDSLLTYASLALYDMGPDVGPASLADMEREVIESPAIEEA